MEAETKATLGLNGLLECCSKLEAGYKKCQDELEMAEKSVEKKDRDLICAQLQVNNLKKRIQEMDEANEICENKLKDTFDQMVECNRRRANEFRRIHNILENQTAFDRTRFTELEKQVAELSMRTENAHQKITETSKIIAMLEDNLELAESKATNSDMKLLQLQDQMQVLGNFLKSFEVSADKSRMAERELTKRIKDLKKCVKQAEARAKNGGNHVYQLRLQINNLSADLKNERKKLNSISREMEAVLQHLI